MSDKQWVVLPREPTQEMVKAAYNGCQFSAESFDDFREVLRYGLAAAPRYEAGDVVEVAHDAYELAYDTERHRGGTSEHAERAGLSAALTAALPELVARIEALEKRCVEAAEHTLVVARNKNTEIGRLDEELARLRGELDKVVADSTAAINALSAQSVQLVDRIAELEADALDANSRAKERDFLS